jgi:hypothetical protein
MSSDTMTLAFELAALQRTREPQAVVVDARRWAQHVGLLSADPDAADAFSAEHLVRRDFQARSTVLSLRHLSSRFETERHVLVGDASEQPEFLPQDGWEYLGLEDAATAAGWDLEDPETKSRTRWSRWSDRVSRTRK